MPIKNPTTKTSPCREEDLLISNAAEQRVRVTIQTYCYMRKVLRHKARPILSVMHICAKNTRWDKPPKFARGYHKQKVFTDNASKIWNIGHGISIHRWLVVLELGKRVITVSRYQKYLQYWHRFYRVYVGTSNTNTYHTTRISNERYTNSWQFPLSINQKSVGQDIEKCELVGSRSYSNCWGNFTSSQMKYYRQQR